MDYISITYNYINVPENEVMINTRHQTQAVFEFELITGQAAIAD